ncbi:MAG: hypothetical protein ABJH06_14700 [Paraglaciecola sp.]|uniref:spermine/spermidine synthase domain-containing protein n=1 Tax=Paraglaciecola sp. TaxID=1920173 RepID=UPI003299E3FF
MIPWSLVDTAKIPNDGGELKLSQRGGEFTIKKLGKRGGLIDSRIYNSDKVLAQVGCAHIKPHHDAHVLVAGLAMGYTLTAALKAINSDSQVTVSEVTPEVVEWNKGPLGQCAGNPLQDPRTHVHIGDVKQLLSARKPTYDAILLNVSHAPKSLHPTDNHSIYSEDGLKDSYDTLGPNGMLAILAVEADYLFTLRLKKIGFKVDTRNVQAGSKKGKQPTIFLARKL